MGWRTASWGRSPAAPLGGRITGAVPGGLTERPEWRRSRLCCRKWPWPERKERDLSEAWADLGPGGVRDATGSGSLVCRVTLLF